MKLKKTHTGLFFILAYLYSTLMISNTINVNNKVIPVEIAKEVNIALSYYPALENTSIEFVIEESLKNSFMKAQPVFTSLLNPASKRRYKIFISSAFQLESKKLELKDIPKKALIGWIGHELGHIMDYKERSSLNLIGFGIMYYFSGNYIRKAERIADSFAVSHNMHEYILTTKNFILNNADLSDKYKDRIKRYYVSPNEILKIVDEQKALKIKSTSN